MQMIKKILTAERKAKWTNKRADYTTFEGGNTTSEGGGKKRNIPYHLHGLRILKEIILHMLFHTKIHQGE